MSNELGRLKALIQKFHPDKRVVLSDDQLRIVYDFLFNRVFYPIKERLAVRDQVVGTILYLNDMTEEDGCSTLDGLENYYKVKHEQMGTKFDLLDFEPIFYIVDKGRIRLMHVKREDKYEYSGVYMGKRGDSFLVDGCPYYPSDIWPANLGKSHIQEYVSNYEFTKSREEAYTMFEEIKDNAPLTTEQMQYQNSNPDFKY